MPTASTRHGAICFEEDQVLQMLGGLVGFPDATRFVLLENADIEPLRWLVSVEQPDLSFLVIDPRLVVQNFTIGLSEEDRVRLEIGNANDVLPLAIAVLSERPDDSTANLRAPIVVNSSRMLAAQIVLSEGDHSVQHPLLPRGPG